MPAKPLSSLTFVQLRQALLDSKKHDAAGSLCANRLGRLFYSLGSTLGPSSKPMSLILSRAARRCLHNEIAALNSMGPTKDFRRRPQTEHSVFSQSEGYRYLWKSTPVNCRRINSIQPRWS